MELSASAFPPPSDTWRVRLSKDREEKWGKGRTCITVTVSPFSGPWGSASFCKLHQLDKSMYSFLDEFS